METERFIDESSGNDWSYKVGGRDERGPAVRSKQFHEKLTIFFIVFIDGSKRARAVC